MKQKMIAIALGTMAVAAVPAAVPAIAQHTAAHPEARISTVNQDSNMRAFPAAEKGQKRHVIMLPQLTDETKAKVEIIVGRTMSVDCNNHRFGGRLEERTAEGWGFYYYVLKELGAGASTLMGCNGADKRTAFVTSPDQPLIRYNSKLPVVVYTPANVEVRYRIWRADDEQTVG